MCWWTSSVHIHQIDRFIIHSIELRTVYCLLMATAPRTRFLLYFIFYMHHAPTDAARCSISFRTAKQKSFIYSHYHEIVHWILIYADLICFFLNVSVQGTDNVTLSIVQRLMDSRRLFSVYMRVCLHSHQLPIIEWRQSFCLFICFFFSHYFRIFWRSSVFLLHYSHCSSSHLNLEVIDNVNNDKKKS